MFYDFIYLAKGFRMRPKVRSTLNKFSFFEVLESNLLPPSQIQISPKLTDYATLIYRNNGIDTGKVVVSKLVL